MCVCVFVYDKHVSDLNENDWEHYVHNIYIYIYVCIMRFFLKYKTLHNRC